MFSQRHGNIHRAFQLTPRHHDAPDKRHELMLNIVRDRCGHMAVKSHHFEVQPCDVTPEMVASENHLWYGRITEYVDGEIDQVDFLFEAPLPERERKNLDRLMRISEFVTG